MKRLILILTVAASLLFTRTVQACEIAMPSNFLYIETVEFDAASLVDGVTVRTDPPAWVTADNLTGFVQLENTTSAEMYLLRRSQIEKNPLEDGQQVSSSLWTQGLTIAPQTTVDFIGEGNLNDYAANITPQNVNNFNGDPLPNTQPPAETQRGTLYLVVNGRAEHLPFTISYAKNPAYKPEGTFHQPTLAERVALATYIVDGTALTSAETRDSSARVRVHRWLKGSGPDEITISGFSDSSCDVQIAEGTRRIFLLRQDNAAYWLNSQLPGTSDAVLDPVQANQIESLVGQPAPIDAGTPAATPSEAVPQPGTSASVDIQENPTMILTLMLVTFLVAFLCCSIVAYTFNKPIGTILDRLVTEELSLAWRRYMLFAIYVVGISGGIRVWELEKYIQPIVDGVNPYVLDRNRWILELYRTVIETLQSVAWMLLAFFLIALVAYIIMRGLELRRVKPS